MPTPAELYDVRGVVNELIARLRGTGFRWINFPQEMEDRFEADTRKERSYRLWLEGLVAILVLNGCLLADYLLVHDRSWLPVVQRTLVVTPLALVVNLTMRFNPVRWVREGSVAAAMVAICAINLVVQGTATTSHALYGAICTLITVLFVGVVMRLRLGYTVASVIAMLAGGLWTLAHARCLDLSEIAIGGSLMVVGSGIVLVASYSLEKQERLSYLLCLQGDIQTSDLACMNAELHRVSNLDKLTGLPNRRALEDHFERVWASCGSVGEPVAAVVVDVDHFKKINDVHGHLHGDKVLQRIGGALPEVLRSEQEMAARFGGEEFLLLLPGVRLEDAVRVAERVRAMVEGMGLTVSCGVSACVPGAGVGRMELVAAADKALYEAKRGGRNRVEMCEFEMEKVEVVVRRRDMGRQEMGRQLVGDGMELSAGL